MRIPIQLPDVNDVDEMEGFLYLEKDYLVFEYYILSWGLAKGETHTVKAERGVIDGIRLEERLLKDRLCIATHNIQLLKEIPGKHVSEVILKTKKRYRNDVRAFVEHVRAWKDTLQDGLGETQPGSTEP